MAPPPPPPPPPLCLPSFSSKKHKRRLSGSSADPRGSYSTGFYSQNPADLARHASYSSHGSHSSSSTLKAGAGHDSRTSLTFHSDSEKYDPTSADENEYDLRGGKKLGRSNTFLGGAGLSRGNTMTGTKKSAVSSKWGYGWTLGKKKGNTDDKAGADLTREMSQKSMGSASFAPPTSPPGLKRSDTRSTQASKSSKASRSTHHTSSSKSSVLPVPPPVGVRPRYNPHDSQDTLVGSMLDRKVLAEPSGDDLVRISTGHILAELRKLMEKDALDYYLIPHDDAHMSEYVAERDQRVKFISGFSGSAGTAIITRSSAYLFTDSRYWIQAREQIDNNWSLIELGKPGRPTDWVEWLLGRIKNSRIGLDARMLSHEKASVVSAKLNAVSSKFVYPPQNLVDLVWKDHKQPSKSREEIYIQPVEFTGKEAKDKLKSIRKYITAHAPDLPSYARGPPTPAQQHTGVLLTHLPAIAWTLNLRGCDIPYNPLFHSYLFVGLDRTVLFVDTVKVTKEVDSYLKRLDISIHDYVDIWTFLRRREWGDGKLIISPQTSYAISLMLTHFRFTVEPSYVEKSMAIKNEIEISGMKRAYLRDGVSFVRFLAWLDEKFNQGYDISEWEAAWRLTEFRKKNKSFMGLAYQNISASGPNAALPHYAPSKESAALITKDKPYLNDSGGQYREGTCDTTRTVHFGRPTSEQCEAYTRVLQGHIAIDSAVFPEGTSGYQLDVLARKALWRDGMNYMHGTGHGFGQFLTVHEGPHGFSSSVPLQSGMVITNEPGFYKEGDFGVRIESALVVKKMQTKHSFHGDIWLGFERLTVVPIQTRMVNVNMLTKEEKAWIKAHNKLCYEKLSSQLKDDPRALKWLKRETDRDIGLAPGLGGATIDWG